MSKFDVALEGEELKLGLDLNEDGEKLLEMKVKMSEAIQEAFKRGDKVEGAKLVDFGFEGGGLKLKLDTDQDGENLLELDINLMEAVDEVGLLKS